MKYNLLLWFFKKTKKPVMVCSSFLRYWFCWKQNSIFSIKKKLQQFSVYFSVCDFTYYLFQKKFLFYKVFALYENLKNVKIHIEIFIKLKIEKCLKRKNRHRNFRSTVGNVKFLRSFFSTLFFIVQATELQKSALFCNK